MTPIKTVFFGSTADSVLILEKLQHVVAVVTQPPKPVGRDQTLTPTPVETWARAHHVSATTLDAVAPFTPDLLVSASYGEKIPAELISETPHGGLNVHPSLLPRWRGADPVPWAILEGDHQIGVTVVTLSEQFDRGRIIDQKKYPITPHDTTIPLRTKLFAMGADLLVESLPDYLSGKNKGKEQKAEHEPVSKRLTRDMGYEPWEKIIDPAQSAYLNRKFRAFTPWPGLWTMFGNKRLKILDFTHEPITVQLEGKNPVSWGQFKTAYLSS